MEATERTTLLMIALAAQALLDRLETLTTEEFSRGGERKEREALRAALTWPCGCPATDHTLAAQDGEAAVWLCAGCLHACPGITRGVESF